MPVRVNANTVNIVNTCFQNKAFITSVDLRNVPWKDNSMCNAFNGCYNLQTVSNINQNITNMYYTFWQCYNLVNAPVIPNSVTNMYGTFRYCTNLVNAPVIPNSVTGMYQTFYYCTNLVNAPVIPNSVTGMYQTFANCSRLVNAPVIPNSVTNMYQTFYGCTNLVNSPVIPNSVTNMYQTFYYCRFLTAPEIPNSVTNMGSTFAWCNKLTGNVNIYSNKITNATQCFIGTTLEKNVYIPFKYENGVNSATYNSFVAAGYSTTTRVDGALLFDINPSKKYIETDGYEFTNANDKVSLTKYTGTSATVTVPTIQEE